MKDMQAMLGIDVIRFTECYCNQWKRKVPREVSEKAKVEAVINQGRWIVECPYCGGAELADRKTKLFYCMSCFNRDNGGLFIKVQFPKDMEKIDAILEKRPEINQNWRPGESVKDIQRENKECGL